MKRVPISLFILLTVRAAHGTTFTVVNTNDSRDGPLRHASTGANASAGTGDEDFLYRAHVNHPTLDDNADTHPADDDCPRAPLPGGVDPNPDGKVKDKGCGSKDKVPANPLPTC